MSMETNESKNMGSRIRESKQVLFSAILLKVVFLKQWTALGGAACFASALSKWKEGFVIQDADVFYLQSSNLISFLSEEFCFF